MIRYLKQEEKIKTRVMYEKAFFEDSPAFVDYYYKYKTADNQILVMEEEGRLQMMIHLNPYCFSICKKRVKVNYIVAVATDVSVRRQGKMAQGMGFALKDMAKKKQPFTFLIPANPQVYKSSGFSFVPAETYEKLWTDEGRQSLQAAELKKVSDYVLQKAEKKDVKAMAVFANELLEQEYDIFPLRDEGYYLRKMAELESQQGELLLLKNNESIRGIIAYGREEGQTELQELLVRAEEEKICRELSEDCLWNRNLHPAEMRVMVRILDLHRLVSMLRSDVPLLLKARIKDEILPQNCGSFQIQIDSNGGRMMAIDPAETEVALDIAKLAEVLFRERKTFMREWV